MDTRVDSPDSSAADPLQSGPFERALIVVNPTSGRGQALAAAEELAEGLRKLGVQTELFRTTARGDAFTRLRSLGAGTDLVVSAGGDGTLREVLDGLVDPDVPVGLLPYGTANVLAATLGYPRDVHLGLEILLRKRIQEIDVARVNGKLSFLCAGVGFDAACVRALERKRHGPIHKWTYFGAVASVMRTYRPPRLTVELDGERLPGIYGFVLVANTWSYAGVIRLAEDARLDDRLFEVYLFRSASRISLVRAFLRGALHRLHGGNVELRRASRIKITAEEPAPYQIDGDLGGETPVEIELAPNRYRLLVP